MQLLRERSSAKGTVEGLPDAVRTHVGACPVLARVRPLFGRIASGPSRWPCEASMWTLGSRVVQSKREELDAVMVRGARSDESDTLNGVDESVSTGSCARAW